MTEWLLENRDWLGTAIPFSAIINAISLWLLGSKYKPAIPPSENKPNSISFISNTYGYALSSKIEFPLLMPEQKHVTAIK
jgi:hypothetical protein